MRVCEKCSVQMPAEKLRYPNARFCSEDCRWRAYHAKKRSVLREYNRAWRKSNPEKVAATLAKSRQKRIKSLKEWKARNPSRVRELARLSAKRCKATVDARRSAWAKNNIDRMREHRRKWKESNKWKVAADVRNRQLSKSRAKPKWLTKQQRKEIESLYKKATELTATTGVPHDVDHIVPIRGKIVCGLHVPWNLQVLKRSENHRKSNKLQTAVY